MPLFSKRLNWLYKALDLNESQLPVNLDTTTILSNLDVLQNGFGLIEKPRQDSLLIGQNEAAQIRTLIDASNFLNDQVTVIEFNALNSTAGAWAENLQLRDTIISGNIVRITNFSIAAGARVGLRELIPGLDRLVIPRGWNLEITTVATGAGESVSAEWIFEVIPHGFRGHR